MGTPAIAPRAAHEGCVGTADTPFAEGHFDVIRAGNLYDSVGLTDAEMGQLLAESAAAPDLQGLTIGLADDEIAELFN